ncbi:MAG: hypothetical protein QOI58_3802 [Thermoanaerobaculia bacterium]|jgi:hypothetical protein|nr:hypothetical protein [Thermoanaerobaculia bacterium]
MAVSAEREASVNGREGERYRGVTLYLFFLIPGLISLGYSWMTVQQRLVPLLSTSADPQRAHTILVRWLDHGYFASHGLLWPVADGSTIYRSATGAHMISAFLVEKIWIGITGRYGWKLLALHNELLVLLTAALLALLCYRTARRFGATPVPAFVAGVAAQSVWLTFPDVLSVFWHASEQVTGTFAAIGFLLLEERALDGGRTRRLTILQALAMFALAYIEIMVAVGFVASYLAALLLLRGERIPWKRLAAVLILPPMFAAAIYGVQLLSAKAEARRTGVKLYGSGFLYRSGLDGDAMFYGEHLDIAFGRDMLRAHRDGNTRFLFHWPGLFFAGAISLLAVFAAYLRGRAPRIAIIVLVTLTGPYLIYAAVFSQAVVLHPYLYDVLLMTPLVIALFGMMPALAESLTGRTGLIILIALFAAMWLSMFQLRLYALTNPAPQPAGVLAAPNGGRP